MLMIIYGTSCVGKTTIMNKLVSLHGWNLLYLHTTRRIRPRDTNRRFMDDCEMRMKARTGEVRLIENCYGNTYGIPVRDVREAAADPYGLFLIDCPIQYRRLFEDFNHYKIILMMESMEQLLRQIVKADRIMRRDVIIGDYEELYLKQEYEEFAKQINYEDNETRTVNEIISKFDKWAKRV